jgi:hypothetical protein
VALLAGDGELEGIDACQALAAIGITDKGDALERDGVVQQFEVELGAMLFDPLQGFSRSPWLCHNQAPAVATSIRTKRFSRVSICICSKQVDPA